MIAEIVATGNEIITGALVDGNSACIAEKIESMGIRVLRHHAVGDDLDQLAAIIKEISMRADIAIVTGGLGPTMDDLTSEAAAMASGERLSFFPEAMRQIESFFEKFDRPMPDSNRKQAWFPAHAHIVPNPVGTAPGFHMKIKRCRFFCLPGVPREMRQMMDDFVLPGIRGRFGADIVEFVKNQTVTTFGLTESTVNERMGGMTGRYPDIKFGLRAKFPEIHIKLYGRGKNKALVTRQMNDAWKILAQIFGEHVLSKQGLSMPEVVGANLLKNKKTIAVAESCTGGRIADLLTRVPGSSGYFLFSGVTYADHAKENVLGVKRETLEQYGAVHKETAKEMAGGARSISGADYAVATTGIAGPDGGTREKPVGTVCIGLAAPDAVRGYRHRFNLGSRDRHKTIFAYKAMDLLRREFLEIL